MIPPAVGSPVVRSNASPSGAQHLLPADRAVGAEPDDQQRRLARLELPGERPGAALVRPAQPIDAQPAGLACQKRQPMVREGRGELLPEAGTRERECWRRATAAREVQIGAALPALRAALSLQPDPAAGEADLPPPDLAEVQGCLGAASLWVARGVCPHARIQVRSDPGLAGCQIEAARDRERRGGDRERSCDPDRPGPVAEPDLPGRRQGFGEAGELWRQRADARLGRADPAVDPAALDREGELAPALDRPSEVGQREMFGRDVDAALSADRSQRDTSVERQMAMQIEIGAKAPGVVDQLPAGYADAELGLGPAGSKRARDRQPELAPGRRELDLGAPQHHLLGPGGQGKAAAVLAGAGSEPGELEPALDDPALQLQPFGLDAGDPPAHQIPQPVTDSQACEPITGRRPDPQAGELEATRSNLQIVECHALDSGHPQSGAQQGAGKP